MDALKVFLACSKQRELLADVFQKQLEAAAKRASFDLEIVPWYRDQQPGEDALTFLINHCRGTNGVKPSDFFVLILADKDQETEDCVFELGVFLGGLGFEPRRCFVLSPEGLDVLPTTLRGRFYIRFAPVPLADANDAMKLGKALADAAGTVRDNIQQLKAFGRSQFDVMTIDALMDLERPESEGGALAREAEVLVNRSQPAEENQESFAARVLANMRAHRRRAQ